jgi:hypothetical protein
MAKKNVFISHRWDYPDDYNQISAMLDRSKYEVSDRSVERSNPLAGTQKEITEAIKGKINSASVILVPARPAAISKGTMGRKEVDYAVSQCKKIVAVDTDATSNVATYWKENDIQVIPCRKDSLAKEIG